MGNQLAGIAPAQILSVDSYFSDIHEFEYDKSLGSTRFFKVARAKHREGLAVVKVFAVQDPSLPLSAYRQELEELRQRLLGALHCVPFQRASLTEKAALLFRQYVRDNLYDRISTRPFLNNVEKKWIAFQLLNALEQAHRAGVRHGDIKTENVMVTSWNWVLLTDFASFKPTYLPEDNPADFNYFFDTSRRRTCYIAPERFVDGTLFSTELEAARDSNTPLVDLTSNSQRMRGELKPAMDVFSAGCVIVELFTEGVPMFDLSQLLAYRNGHFSQEHVLNKIEDLSIRGLVSQMIQRDPEKRLTAEEHLKQQRENIALLAETALRFLEIVQLNNLNVESELHGEETEEILHPNENYDSELQGLHEMVQQKVVTLLSDPENIVKQTLMENGITRLCVFFGRQKANDVLLSHMITFLNDKNDWHLRGAFFDSIVGVAAYVGWQSSSILKPLLQQGLSDAEEFVIYKALNAMTCMCQLGLLQKPHIYEFANDIAPFLCHPNLWICYGAVGFMTVVAQHLNIADVYCKLMPFLNPFISQPIIQIDKEIVLLSVVKEPVNRSIFDYVLRSKDIISLYRHLHLRHKMRNGLQLECSIREDPVIAQLLKKLLSQGMSEADEDKLLALKDFMLKSNKAKANVVDQSHMNDSGQSGMIDLAALGIPRRHIDLVKTKQENDDKRARRHVKQDSSLNEEWKSMFGSLEHSNIVQSKALAAPGDQENAAVRNLRSESAPGMMIAANSALQQVSEGTAVPTRKPATSLPVLQSGNVPLFPSTYQRRITTCVTELQQLIQQKREQCNAERMAKQLMESAEWESKSPPPGWHPKGLLVAHIHEHKSAVNRIRVSDEHSIFATCSNDGTVKIWDSQKMEGKTTTTRSILTYSRIGGKIKTLAFCQGSHYLAVASDIGTVQLLGIEASKPPKSPKIHPLQSRILDQKEDGSVVDIHHFNAGTQSVLAYATVNGSLVGWDLRSSTNAWTLKHDLRLGLITSFAVDIHQCWLCIGTSNGTMSCWDMRFQLPISSHYHPARARIRQLIMHPLCQSWVVAAVQGNNEVSMWDMETGDRRFTLWASSAPPLSEMQPSVHSVHGIYCSPADGNPLLLTAGSDMRIRFWDLAYPERSYIVAGSANDILHCPSVSYYRKIIEGTEVVQEIHNKQKVGSSEDVPRRGPESLPIGHHDIITDLAAFQTTQGFIVTASRDGIIKVWK
ncbi:phosphoinositide 3-kinase regulatory subunit 4 isoform X3 [Narcine bancroftii]|uniref:phosphoinositide 3-kinase regulatory subunit 4 isoform X3 n=1 Tax=Narcine bancroftii TaxID=1343680 RepID=UPI00383217B1